MHFNVQRVQWSRLLPIMFGLVAEKQQLNYGYTGGFVTGSFVASTHLGISVIKYFIMVEDQDKKDDEKLEIDATGRAAAYGI